MKFTLSWLKEFLDTSADVFTLTEALTACGLEVESVDNPAATLKPFVVAEIVEAARHPDAEKLQICKVKAAQGELQIVCGAPNARAGIKVVLANVGTVIPTNAMEIKKSKIRGVESQGMLCSARELGLGEDHAGIMELPLDVAIGTSIVDVLGLNDPVIDVAITANRGDCMSIRGIARDLAAKGIGTLKPIIAPAITTQGASTTSVRIDAPELCPVFIGRTIRGVRNAASPEWLQQKLKSVGLRPISALVDITNYMTIAYGRPLHVYDSDTLRGGIHVRAANAGESFAALNDKSYTLDAGMCVIADDASVLGLGGIVGGVPSGVTESTQHVFLECAYFAAGPIGATGRALGVDSDARARFERGIDPEFMLLSVDIATQLIIELCGGTACEAVIAGSIPDTRKTIPFRAEAINALGGTNIAPSAMEKSLISLGFTIKDGIATSPSWRHDISKPADLAEEVLRLQGYDSIPSVSLPKPALLPSRVLNDVQLRLSRVRRLLAGRGLHETHTWGFGTPEDGLHFVRQSEGLHLRNAISSELSVMRASLIPHLLRGVAKNQSRGFADVHLFEVGAVFGEDKPQLQENAVAAVRVGQCGPAHWQSSHIADVYTAKADAESIVALCGLETSKLSLSTDGLPSYYHSGRASVLRLGPKNILGYVGELHPMIAQQYDVQGRIVMVELFLDRIPATKASKRKALQVSDFQSVTRDFAFVVDALLPASDLLKAVNAADKILLRDTTLFDVYQGKGVENGKKSLGIRITVQASDRTLTDAEIDAVAQSVINAAQGLGGVLR